MLLLRSVLIYIALALTVPAVVVGQAFPTPSPIGRSSPTPSPVGSSPTPSPVRRSFPTPSPIGRSSPTPSPVGNTSNSDNDASCSSSPLCQGLNLTGDCCPTSDGVTFLDCCTNAVDTPITPLPIIAAGPTPSPVGLPTPSPIGLPTPSPVTLPTPSPVASRTVSPTNAQTNAVVVGQASTFPPPITADCDPCGESVEVLSPECVATNPIVAQIIAKDSGCGRNWDAFCIVEYNDCYQQACGISQEAFIAEIASTGGPQGRPLFV